MLYKGAMFIRVRFNDKWHSVPFDKTSFPANADLVEEALAWFLVGIAPWELER